MCRITMFLLRIWDCPSNTEGYTNMASPWFGRTPQGAKILLMWEQTMKTNLEQTVRWPHGVHVCRQRHRLWLQWACFLGLYLRSDPAGNFMAKTITNRTKCCHVNPVFPKLKRKKIALWILISIDLFFSVDTFWGWLRRVIWRSKLLSIHSKLTSYVKINFLFGETVQYAVTFLYSER